MACNNGEVLGEPNAIRIFSIDYIKGLEFEAVFYHNIDMLFVESDLGLRQLYVGLSRATFYLGITLSGTIADLNFIQEEFLLDGSW